MNKSLHKIREEEERREEEELKVEFMAVGTAKIEEEEVEMEAERCFLAFVFGNTV